jgi:phosphoglycerate dehydrogenase-like enzyme
MKLVIFDPLAEEYKRHLKPLFPEMVIFAFTDEEGVGGFIQEADILFTGKISDETIQKATRLQWIQAKTAGVDYLLNLPSLRREVVITSTRGIHGPQMSEMAILLMLALNRNFPQIVRNQDQKIWDRWPGRLLYQKKVGILGIGMIGEEIARKCKSFNMTVLGIDVVRRKIDAVDFFYEPDQLCQILPELDYFIIVVPLTAETRAMIDARVLSAMKPTAFFINIGRGEIVDETALIQALQTGKIAGAALDTFWTEPLRKDHPLWEMKNVIITPHVGGMSDIYVEQVLPIFEENLRRFLQGERRNLTNLIEH